MALLLRGAKLMETPTAPPITTRRAPLTTPSLTTTRRHTIQCPALTPPTNGAVSPPGATSFPNIARFTCNTGYVLTGTATASCQADGSWSNAVPTCSRRQCSPLAAPTNGVRTPATGSNFFQDLILFSCNTGYILTGAATTTCQADGSWSNAVPACTLVQCQSLTAPTNGALTPTGTTSYQTMVTFTCNTGYDLNGADDTTCQADGTWSHVVPTCTAVQCAALTPPTNGAVNPTGATSFPNMVSFTCNTGYVLTGTATASCKADGSWSNAVPTCSRRQCPLLASPSNGVRTPTTGSNFFQDIVSFRCNTGYILTGDATTTCQADGSWSNTVPTCTPVRCQSLTHPANGWISPAGRNKYQDVVQFSCITGFQLNGESAVTCLADGTWSDTIPTCTDIDECTQNLCHGLATCINTIGSFQCNCINGYLGNGLTCTDIDECTTVPCHPRAVCTNVPGSFTCDCTDGYTGNGFNCAGRQCPPLAAPTNGVRTPPTGETFYQDTVTFTCNTGYQLNGVSPLTCRADGTWSNTVPTCTPVQCPVLTSPTNGVRTPATGANSYQNQIIITCNTGYVLTGTGTLTCQADGTWSDTAPTCTPVQCPELAVPTNGARIPATGANSYQNQITFTCNTGYLLTGTGTLTCQADGTWSDNASTCTHSSVRCPTLNAPNNGVLTPPTGPYTVQQMVTSTCNSGYQLNGDSITRCLDDGTWSNPVPTCTTTDTSTAGGGLSSSNIAAIAGGLALAGVLLLGLLAAVCGGAGAGAATDNKTPGL
ncbi:sushi, von Willebrand factor type A, EGF and pentraxin domain-containing protein 1-like, partial [Branchiostoma floridae]|uniref:Sushi, von Willebrand factor type A, EGF and pentraxin domain-containing protein 1-like n=1 Tax=Branchiostoma floridae TaxID=7739 RepID=A0A9J7KL36_BRAFL